MRKPNRNSEQFINSLIKLKEKDDRKRLSELRRGLSKGTRPAAYGAVAFIGGQLDLAHITIAGLFATHPVMSSDFNLGSTWRKLRFQAHNALPALDEKHTTFEHRFNRLLACKTTEELCDFLRPIITLAKAKEVGINYASLLTDIIYWEASNSSISLEWAREYWKFDSPSEKEPNIQLDDSEEK